MHQSPNSDSLWRHAGFLTLWAGQTVSLFGSRITLLALPLTAVLRLHAGAAQMGLLAAAGSAPWLIVGLPAGVWVDRLRRRPLMVAADLSRALLLFSVPLAAWWGRLHLEQLYLVQFLVGVLVEFGAVIFAINAVTLRQMRTPKQLRGRVNATALLARR